MVKATRQQLWQFCNDMAEVDDSGERVGFDALKSLDLKPVVVDQSMSENHPGGDDVVSMVEETLQVLGEGYAIATWYGSDAEVLVLGYRPEQLQLID